MSSLEFFLNQEFVSVRNGMPDLDGNLLDYLRNAGLTGCKKVCGEGGCGACTVVLSRWDEKRSRVCHMSVAACLVPLPTIHLTHITTIEGITRLSCDSVHPLVRAFQVMGASQCGFCTPGFVMTLFARLSTRPRPKKVDLERIFDGNLCRCTGYRSILDAAALFCEDGLEGVEMDVEGRILREAWERCVSLDDVFPEQFKKRNERLEFRGVASSWHIPTELEQLFEEHRKRDESEHQVSIDTSYGKMVAGNTDVGYAEKRTHRATYSKTSLSHLRELQSIHWKENEVTFGAGVSIAEMVSELESKIGSLENFQTSSLKAIHNQCRHFANNQIRAVATIGGGIANFSHYSDLIPVWVACGARLALSGTNRKEVVDLLNCYKGSELKLKIPDNRVLTSITVPFSNVHQRVTSFKYARRRLDSITFMSAGMSVSYQPDTQTMTDPVLCFDGMGTPGLRVVETEQILNNEVWTKEILKKSLKTLRREVSGLMTNGLPKVLQDYQIRLAEATLVRFFTRCREEFYGGAESIDSKLLLRYPRISHRSYLKMGGSQSGILGKAIPNRNAIHQSTGKTKYTTDIRIVNELYAAIVGSPVANGVLKRVSAEDVLSDPDFVGFYSASDIPGENTFGFRIEDEEILASSRVQFVGQAVAIVVAKSEVSARRLASLVKLEIEEKNPIFNIESARKANAFHGKPEGYLLKQGDLKKGFSESCVVVEGNVNVHGQSHFYLEPQNAVVVPKGDGYKVYSSTQSPSNVVDHVSKLLKLRKNQVQVQVAQLGGGFGGKQFRAGPIAALAALGAYHTERPVRLNLDRVEDMTYCRGRSPFLAKYKAGFSSEGKIKAVQIRADLDGGFSNDYSADIAETATLLMDSCYQIPNVEIHGRAFKTNYGSNTATRGFGKPQASAIIETILDHGASTLGMNTTDLRKVNLYKRGDKTITRMSIDDGILQECWNRVMANGNYKKLSEEVEEFNSSNRWFKRGLAVVGSKGNMGFLEADDINRGLAIVQIQRDGTVSVNHSGTEMGQGINTRMAQVASNGLGVPFEMIEVTDTQSTLLPNTPPTTMVATDLIGEAIVKACDELQSRLNRFEGTFQEKLNQAYEVGVSLSAKGIHTAPRLFYDYQKQQGDISYFFVWGAALSVVEVDVISGSIRILKSSIVQDCGKSLNPHLDLGQAEGGFVFGLGYYLMENLIYAPSGRLITDNVTSYKIPSCGDVPLDWDIELLNYQSDGKGIHNSKGIGESNIQLGLSAYFATKEAVRSARKEHGLSSVFELGFPASVENVSRCLPKIRDLI